MFEDDDTDSPVPVARKLNDEVEMPLMVMVEVGTTVMQVGQEKAPVEEL